MGFDTIDKDGYGSHPLGFHRADQLPNVQLFSDDVLTVQQDRHSGVAGVSPQGAMLFVPFQVLSWAGKEALMLRMQAACMFAQLSALQMFELVCIMQRPFCWAQADAMKPSW